MDKKLREETPSILFYRSIISSFIKGVFMKSLICFLGLSLFVASAASAAAFELTSNLESGKAIPADYYANAFGCTAKNMSPSLKWKNAPEGTKSFAITFYDQDAPTGSGFWHYVLVDIPADVSEIKLNDLSKGVIPKNSQESLNDSGKTAFVGSCPPVGRKHNYIYTVHALKVEKLGVPATATPGYVGFNLWGNSLGKASFTVTAGPRK
jgi:Raf kinase inhibitor-like YbhB/YbcL family protein